MLAFSRFRVPPQEQASFLLDAERAAAWAADTRVPLPLQVAGMSGEEVIAIIDAMWNDDSTRLMAVNVPNDGLLSDVAEGTIVEVGAIVDGDGIHPDVMAPLGEPLAGWVNTQAALQEMVVDAALTGDADLAFQALREDPCSPPDEASCRAMFAELHQLQADKLPF